MFGHHLYYLLRTNSGDDPGVTVFSLDAVSGQLGWSYYSRAADSSADTPPLLVDKVVLVYDGALVLALAADDGRLLWKKPAPPRATLTSSTATNTIVAWNEDSVIAYRASTGQQLWSRSNDDLYYKISDVLAVDTRLILVHPDALESWSMRTAAAQWRVRLGDNDVLVSLGGHTLDRVIVRHDQLIEAFNIATGQLMWRSKPAPSSIGPKGRGLLVSSRIIVMQPCGEECGPSSPLYRAAYDARTGRELWRRSCDCSPETRLIWVGQTMLLEWDGIPHQVLYPNKVRLLDATTGVVKWERYLVTLVPSGVAGDGHSAYVVSLTGAAMAVRL